MATQNPDTAEESARLAALHRYRLLDTAKEAAFDRLTALAAQLFGVPIALISMVDRDRVWFKSVFGLDAEQVDRESFCGYAIQNDQVMVVPDALRDSRFADHPSVVDAPGVRFYAGAPLIAPDGHRVGSLCLIDGEPRDTFAESERALLRELAAVVVDYMEMRVASHDVLSEITHRIDAEARAAATESQLRVFVEHAPAAIAMLDKDLRYLVASRRWREAVGTPSEDLFGRRMFDNTKPPGRWNRALAECLTGVPQRCDNDTFKWPGGRWEFCRWALHPWHDASGEVAGVIVFAEIITEQVEATREIERQSRFLHAALENIQDGILAYDANGDLTYMNPTMRQMMGTHAERVPNGEWTQRYPLLHEDGTTPVAIEERPLERAIRGEEVRDFRAVYASPQLGQRHLVIGAQPMIAEDGTTLGAISSTQDVTDSRLNEQKLRDSEAHARRVAFSDALTGLPNRARLHQYLSADECPGGSRKTALLYIDLDRFRSVNDTLGHDAGDTVLCQIAEALREVGGEDAFTARVSSDEFVLIKPVGSVREARELAYAVQEPICSPIALSGHTFALCASIGVAVSPDHGNFGIEMMRKADLALHEARRDGRGKIEVFRPAMERDAKQRRHLELELRSALENDQLTVHYQPIVGARDAVMIGVEALARWEHPRRGLIMPADFMPLAEETGLIVELGEAILRRALRDGCQWPDLSMSVNLSPVQFRDDRLIERIRNALDDTGFDPHRLELEVTESLLLHDTEVARSAISALREMGISIALDDFGTGYSSLSYLQRFPFTKLKIDRSFVSAIGRDPTSASVIQCIVGLADALGITVTAEGVETRAQEMLLQLAGCATLQGWLFGKPMPGDKLLHHLARQTSDARASARRA